MASIERTAYPCFKRLLTHHELHTFYTPTVDERTFVEHHTHADSLRRSMLDLLKTFQHLGYFPRLDKVPTAIVHRVREVLALSHQLPIGHDHPRTDVHHHAAIRSYLNGRAYGKQPYHVAVVIERDLAILRRAVSARMSLARD